MGKLGWAKKIYYLSGQESDNQVYHIVAIAKLL